MASFNDYDEGDDLLAASLRGEQAVRIPPQVLEIARPRDSVIKYVAPSDDMPIFKYFLSNSLGPLLVIPCFWPFACCLCPCISCGAKVHANAARARAMLLTQSEVISVSLDHDTMICPGLSRSGTEVKNIPLEQITDIAVDEQGNGWVQKCCVQMPSLRLDTPSSGMIFMNGEGDRSILNEATLLGVCPEEALEFRQRAFSAKEARRMGGNLPPGLVQMRPHRTVQERLRELEALFADGVVTQEERDTKRTQILADL